MRLARLGGFEVASTQASGQQFDKHSHDEFVIGANLLGEEQIWLDGRTFSAAVGAITTYNPGAIQGGGARAGQPWRYVSLYLPAPLLAESLGLAQLEFAQPLQHNPVLAAELAQAIELGLSDDAHRRERGEEALIGLLGAVASGARARLPVAADCGQGPITRLQELLASHLAEPPSLDAMALSVGLSKFHLLRVFKRRTGLSPRQWAMQLRTCRAQGLLRQGQAAGAVAHALGFADQSHLNRHFRAAYGLTPGRYQRLLGS
nr:AraC family transcriptional regulator [Pseudomonas insulae]